MGVACSAPTVMVASGAMLNPIPSTKTTSDPDSTTPGSRRSTAASSTTALTEEPSDEKGSTTVLRFASTSAPRRLASALAFPDVSGLMARYTFRPLSKNSSSFAGATPSPNLPSPPNTTRWSYCHSSTFCRKASSEEASERVTS